MRLGTEQFEKGEREIGQEVTPKRPNPSENQRDTLATERKAGEVVYIGPVVNSSG